MKIQGDKMKLTVPELIPILKEYYKKPENGAGGSLHIILENCNVSKADVVFCRQWAIDHNDQDGVKIADMFMKMSRTQLTKLANMAFYDWT